MTAATASAPVQTAGRSRLAGIAMAGLAGALVDFIYASGAGAIGGRSIVRVWQGVAGGWLGPAARDGGLATAGLGLATHLGIAACMAAAYALAAERLPILYRRPLLTGALYGLALYAVMYRIVLPLRWPAVFPRWDGVQSAADVLAHVGVGLAIALVLARRHGARSA
jgi:hypothetical protein